MAYRQLGEFAELKVKWKGLAGNYTPASFDPNALPSDEEIEAIRDAIPSKIYSTEIAQYQGILSLELWVQI